MTAHAMQLLSAIFNVCALFWGFNEKQGAKVQYDFNSACFSGF